MPRSRPKTATGADAQPVTAMGPAQHYGQGIDTTQAMHAAPLADNRTQADKDLTAGIAAARTRAAAVTQNPAAPAPAEDPALAAAAGMGITGSLAAPTAYPDRPVTHGLTQGPGAGPEVLQGAGDIAAGAPIWRLLAQASGDPYFEELAHRAGLA